MASGKNKLGTLFGRHPEQGFVSIPAEDQLQARITRNGVSRSKLFSVSRYDGDHRTAWHAACDWLDGLTGEYARKPFRLHQQTHDNRVTNGGVGVFERIVTDQRRAVEYIRFDVAWYNPHGKQRSKTFHVGRLDVVSQAMIDCAARAAHDFRADFEATRRRGEFFDETPWNNWRRDYGFNQLVND